jgi:hypothetical protein
MPSKTLYVTLRYSTIKILSEALTEHSRALEIEWVAKSASCTLRFVHTGELVALYYPILDPMSHPLNSSSNASCASGYLFFGFS